MLKRNILSETISGCIFEPFEYPVFTPTVKVHTLIPRHFCDTTQQSQPKLGIVLSTGCLLTLSTGKYNHVRNAAIACPGNSISNRLFKHFPVAAVYCDCHPGLKRCRLPIAIRKISVMLKRRIPHFPEPSFTQKGLFLCPPGIGMTENLSRIYEHESLKTCCKHPIDPSDFLQSHPPCV